MKSSKGIRACAAAVTLALAGGAGQGAAKAQEPQWVAALPPTSGWTYLGVERDGEGESALFARPGGFSAAIIKSLTIRREYADSSRAFRSSTEQLLVDCDHLKMRSEDRETFAEPALKGARQTQALAEDWREVGAGTPLEHVVADLCASSARHPGMQAVVPTSEGPSVPYDAAEPASPQVLAPSPAASALPSPSPAATVVPVTGLSEGPEPPSDTSAPGISVAPPAQTSSLPTPSLRRTFRAPEPGDPEPETSGRASRAAAARAQRTPPPVDESVATSRRADRSVQIASYHGDSEARAGLKALGRRFAAEFRRHPLEIETAEHGGGAVFRLVAPGFDADAALSVCERVRAAGGACFVRR